MRNLPVNKTGYLKGAKTAKNPVNVIPSNLITTQGMAFPIKANGKTLYPNTGQYKFNTPYVVETPLKQKGTKSTKTETEFGSPSYFRNLFNLSSPGNPTSNKKYNKKLMEQYTAATKRGLSSEGLGDLALGVSGEAIAGAAIKGGKAVLKPIASYADDLYQASKAKGKLTLPTYENLYRWHPDWVPDKLAEAGKLLTPEQQALTGKWFTRDIKQTPFYAATRPAPGNLKVLRTSKVKANELENSLSGAAKGMSGKTGSVPIGDTHHPGEVILSNKQIAKAKNIRFDENPAVKASAHPDYQALEKTNVAKSYKRGMLEHLTLPEIEKSVEHLNKPILGINRKYFPFKKGTKDMKPLIKYKDGSKGVSLSFGRKEKDPKGGLTQKGVDKYNRATGGNLKMAVTTPPSKLKPGSKAANRRKSFCARMSGVKGPMEKNGKPTRKALALRKWNC